MPHRYFTTEISNGTATLRGADAHHLSRVMRGRLGDTVILCDGNAVEYTATITGFGAETVEFSASSRAIPAPPNPPWTSPCWWATPSRTSWSRSSATASSWAATTSSPSSAGTAWPPPKRRSRKTSATTASPSRPPNSADRGVLPDVALPLPNFGALCRSLEVRPRALLLRMRRRAPAPAAG